MKVMIDRGQLLNDVFYQRGTVLEFGDRMPPRKAFLVGSDGKPTQTRVQDVFENDGEGGFVVKENAVDWEDEDGASDDPDNDPDQTSLDV